VETEISALNDYGLRAQGLLRPRNMIKMHEVCSMEGKKNVLSAIAAAVHLYMQAEQQVVAPAEDQHATRLPGTAHSPWPIAGRQSAMDMRRLWQMRLVR
jgi:hypothetical protein